jgi:prophage antirepressor-like protein
MEMTNVNVETRENEGKILDLRLASKELFEGFEIECYEDASRENGDFYLTIEQIIQALGYEKRDSVDKVISRKRDKIGEPHLTDNLSDSTGRRIHLYSFEQLFEIMDGSRQPKADAFRKWAIRTLKELITGRAELKFKNKSDEMDYKSEISELRNLFEDKMKGMEKYMIETNKNMSKLIARHTIFENPSSLFSNLLTNFHAKIYNQGSNHVTAYSELYKAISSYTGKYIPKTSDEAKELNYKNIKDYVIKVIGVDFINNFNEAILDGRIVRVKSGEFIDLSGVFQNDYEWDKIVKTFTDSNGNIHCAYCKKIISKDEAQKEHLIPQSHKESSDLIGNIVVACSDCNTSKNNMRYDEWYPKQSFFDENYYKRIIRHINTHNSL